MRRGAVAGMVALVACLGLSSCGSGSNGGSVTRPPAAVAPCRVTAPAVPTGDHPPPASKRYFGAYALSGVATQTNFISSYNDLQATACRPLTLAHVYLRWTDPFPRPAAATLATDHYLLVSWTGTTISEMASGAVDAQIRATAQQIAALHRPVFLELRWEMDRPNLATTVGSPATFVAAWDRTRAIFTAAGATNVAWVWCPTAGGFAEGRAQAFYPGDSEVDWLCTDAYPSPAAPAGASYPPLSRLVQPFLDWARDHPKPIMIGETGIPVTYSSTARAAWLEAAGKFVADTSRIKAFALFDAAGSHPPGDDLSIKADDPAVDRAVRDLATRVAGPG